MVADRRDQHAHGHKPLPAVNDHKSAFVGVPGRYEGSLFFLKEKVTGWPKRRWQ
jgi:hypothetical protein